ncbi:fimbria/pilus outer membrane usher protein [Polaromonas sp. SM01]|uniref:fimbria/pilus outer membrane usher protein n=1 Tax=Polaromonas sp. SM01 TaxID=3085630 RepID=UPI002981F0E6|nr:fimbria/pilus outer membrane usher protein [Polaromonas sp. SM01]MDW5442468.1 fimbria/pilus outer membrane usher protein [Polaromonas sp. SM01]
MAAQPVSGPDVPPATELALEDAEAQELYLDVTLNGVAMGRLARFARQRGALSASAATLRELGLKWSGSAGASGLVALNQLPGLEVLYDAAQQRLIMTAALDLLDRPVTRIGPVQESRALVDPASRVPGLVLNYDLYAQQGGGQQVLSGFSETRLFGIGPGVWSNTLISRSTSTQGGPSSSDVVRLDTSWQQEFPDQMLSLTVGDLTSGALSWSRATRLGGVRLSRKFALQPYRITTPLASFQGAAVLPSTVDLFVNGLKQSSQQVQPGQFQLNGVPSLGGSGQAQMVITDINGQRREVSFDLYGAPQLLAAGLTDWSVDLGSVRRDYGLKSFAYGDPMASGSARYGWSARTTLEAHAEAGPGAWQAGVGGLWLLGQQAGVVNASLAMSQNNMEGIDQKGAQWGLGYQWNSRRLTAALSTLRRDVGFRDVASQPNELLARGSDSAYLGLNNFGGLGGQLGLNFIRQQYFNSSPVRYAGLSWSYQMPGNAMLSFNVNRNLDNPAASSVYLSWSMPLERRVSVSATARSSGNSQNLVFDASRSPPGDQGGWGWRVQAGAGDSSNAQAQVSQLGRYGQWSAGLSQFGGQGAASSAQTVFGSASGGLVLVQGQAYASRRVDDAFALVSTNGVAGVPVRLENRLVGETDARGMLFVTQLNAYQHNRLSIDTLRLPVDMHIDRAALEAVPDSRSGLLATFAMRRILAVELSLRDAQGQWLPAGSPVWLEAPAVASKPSAANVPSTTVVGHDGLVYLEDPAPDATLRVQLPEGSCRAVLPLPTQASGLVDIGVLRCQ